MNKSHIRELLGNLKAAVRLGHSEAIAIALDELRALPIVAANDHLSAGHLDQLIRPAGEILSHVSTDQLLVLSEDQLTTHRAISAVALAQRFFSGEDLDRSALLALAKDRRPEVRIALGETLRAVGEVDPERVLILLESWMGDSSPKVRATALIALPSVVQKESELAITLLEPLKADQDRDVRAALVNALQAIAQMENADSILAMLASWSTDRHPNVWVITRTLSGAWAASYPKEVEAIIKNLHAQVGETKNITNALRALERHGVEIVIDK